MIRRTSAFLASLLVAIPAALWIARHERLIQRRGRSLSPDERSFAERIGIRNIDAVAIYVVPQIPSPLGGVLSPIENAAGFALSSSAGVTLGYGIYVNERYDSLPLSCHELVHVQQYERLGGPLLFIRRYFYECLAFGYHDSPLEQEAVTLSGR